MTELALDTVERLRAMADAAPVAIFTLDADGRIRTANPAGATLLARPEAKLIGELLVRPWESRDAERLIRECALLGKPFERLEVSRRRADGTPITLSIAGAPSIVPGTVAAVALDFTERRRTDQMLERYRLMAEHARVIIFFIGADGRIADANAAAVETYGYAREELVGMHASRIMVGDSEHRRRDGTTFPVEASTVAADIAGERTVVVVARDTTQRNRRQAFERLLHDIDRRILRNQPLDRILTFTCSRIGDIYGFALVQLSIKGDDGRVTIRKGAGPNIDFLDDLQVRWDLSTAGMGPTGTAIRTGELQFRDLSIDPGFEPWRERAAAYGLRMALALPLIAHDKVLGALTLFTRTVDEIDRDTMNLLVMFADQVAISLLAAAGQEQIALQTVALEAAANAVVVTDSDGAIRWVNPAFEKLTGWTSEEAIGKNPSILKSGNHSPQFYRHMWETVRRGEVWRGELYNRRKDGSLYIEEQTITPVRSSAGEITHFVAIKQDVTARRRHEDQIRYLAMHDALTDLPNRRALDSAMERITWDARRGIPGALLILDVDNFKIVNDTLGHMGGDQVLAELSQLLRLAIRPGDFLARLGGDEFAVLLHNTTLDDAHGAARRLGHAVAEHPFRFGGRVFDLTISTGIAPIEVTSDAPNAMVHADSAMYAAKDQGKNRIVMYAGNEKEGLRVVEAGRWAARIQSALREERFVLLYQPVIRLGSNEPEHYEALIRMIDSDGKAILPEDFISAAERFGLMPQIDRWVVESVLKVLESTDQHLRIFVNISGASLGDLPLLEFIEKRILSAGIPAGRLAFEITETAAVRDLTAAQAWIRKLKDLGCLFAIDDFGVGFSSFNYLRALSADYVKIDRSFVSDVDTNPTNRALVLAVKTVAHTLGKEVIAEGVETEAHADVLREIGVELAQGFRWGTPRPL